MPSAGPFTDGVQQVWTSHEGSMARETARTRWPTIVQDMIEDVERHSISGSEAQRWEASDIMRCLAEMKDEIMYDATLRPLEPDGRSDIEGYNETIRSLPKRATWLNSPWLFSECYIYRRVQTIMARSRYWKDFDVFAHKKDSTFASSRAAIEELAVHFDNAVAMHELGSVNVHDTKQKLLFIEQTQISLWGNQTDLSLLSNLSSEDLKSLQGRDAIAKHGKDIVDDDTEAVWRYLADPSRCNFRVDVVLDNAGFEFFTDVVYSTYLVRAGLADKVVFHVKDFPWFVSDVTPRDVDSMMDHLRSVDIFPNREHLDPLVELLQSFFDSGTFSFRQNSFWTTGNSFHAIKDVAPGLFKCLCKSSLVIFKGDLNYRKLTRDGLWTHSTPFADALGPLGASSGMRVLALRTNKADVCVGVNEARLASLALEAPDEAWVRNGKYGVISFSEELLRVDQVGARRDD